MKKIIFPLLICVIGGLLFFAPFGFAHVCFAKPDGGFMKCHWMGEAVRMLGGLIAASGCIFFIFKQARFGIAFYNIGTGLCLILLETIVIGTCKNPNMACNIYAKPVILLLALILIAVNLLYIFLSFREKK